MIHNFENAAMAVSFLHKGSDGSATTRTHDSATQYIKAGF